MGSSPPKCSKTNDDNSNLDKEKKQQKKSYKTKTYLLKCAKHQQNLQIENLQI